LLLGSEDCSSTLRLLQWIGLVTDIWNSTASVGKAGKIG
jgi:hypothetical protein